METKGQAEYDWVDSYAKRKKKLPDQVDWSSMYNYAFKNNIIDPTVNERETIKRDLYLALGEDTDLDTIVKLGKEEYMRRHFRIKHNISK